MDDDDDDEDGSQSGSELEDIGKVETTQGIKQMLSKRLGRVKKLKSSLLVNDVLEAALGVFSLMVAILEYD